MKAISSFDKSYLIYNCLSISETLLFQLISDLPVKSCNGMNWNLSGERFIEDTASINKNLAKRV